ncbi:MAG: GGDEF domain-containing protein, partial [Candidatus Paceibacterota bacterium]
GLKNAKGFEKKCLEKMAFVEWKREMSLLAPPEDHTPHRLRRTHAIAFVDMDGLKWTNDNPSFGYSVGDHVLRSLANILDRWKRRGDDLVVHRSGDEFLLLFTGSNKKETERLLLQNRRRFEEVVKRDFPGLSGKVSFSFGVCEVNLKNTEKEIASAFDDAGKDMHCWKERRKMDRSVSPLSGDVA